MSQEFVHLQCHTEYSLVDGILRIDEFVAQAASKGMSALAITDQANVFGMVKFYRAALARKVKPIIGCDIWLQAGDEDTKPTRCIVLCQNQQGFKNLSRLLTDAYLHGQRQDKAQIKLSALVEYNAGLIVIAGGRQSDIGLALLAADQVEAQTRIELWIRVFGNRFYLGLARTGRPQEEQYNQSAIELAKKNNCPLVALNEVCFIESSDFDAHEARVCINHGYTLNDQSRPREYTVQQYLRSPEEMAALFFDIPSALENTVQIAKRCNLVLELGKVHLPKFNAPDGLTPEEYLVELAKRGLEERFPQWKDSVQQQKYVERLQIELRVINDMGFASYFLIVADFIGWAFDNKVPVGPGRGSGAGSLVAYVLKITNLDPLQYDLLFERFLNPERVSMPDFDIDFCMEGRDRVIEYVANKYGRASVSQIITYGTMAARAVLRDVGRVLGYGYNFVDQIAKLIPMELGITLDKALEQEELLKTRYQQDEEVKTLINLALRLEGITRNVGKHAGGVVIAPCDLIEFTPLYCEPNNEHTITQFDKDDVESIGLVKFDFLGLRTLTIIDWALQIIKEQNKDLDSAQLDISKINLLDQDTYKLLCATHTTAVFQLESRGMKDLIRRLQPDCFEDIVALVALFRPGPLQSGMVDDFINRKLGRAVIEYPHPDLEPILKATYGVILYQEQVMQIAQVLAGYTLGAADMLRRAMGKKKPEEMAQQREIFTKGAVARGVNEKTATYIFDLMEKFAGYGFNKSHSAAYALVSYQTAWLKAHYPAEFMAAVLSADMTHTDKVVIMIDECHNLGIKVVPPSINHSSYKFSVDHEKKIIYGLGAIKGAGEGAIENIINVRNTYGPFKDLCDFCVKTDSRKVSRRVLETLINAGAMDCLGMHRAALLGNLEVAIKAADQYQHASNLGQSDLFTESFSIADAGVLIPETNFPVWSTQQRLTAEKESLGLYLSGHPISSYEKELEKIISYRLLHLRPTNRGEKVTIAGLLSAVRTMQTKRGDKMAFITIEDRSARQEIALFSDLYNQVRDTLKKDSIIIVQGEVKHDDYSGGLKVRALNIMDLATARAKLAKKISLEIDARTGLAEDYIAKLNNLLKATPSGNCYVEIKYTNEHATAVVKLDKMLKISPSEELLNQIKALDYEKTFAQIVYSD